MRRRNSNKSNIIGNTTEVEALCVIRSPNELIKKDTRNTLSKTNQTWDISEEAEVHVIHHGK